MRDELLETMPFPRGPEQGHLLGPDGVPLHGAYERATRGGHQAALVNNGRVIRRYRYPVSAFSVRSAHDRRFANVLHAVRGEWSVPMDAERPVTEWPASEYPSRRRRTLWSDALVHQDVLLGLKPVGSLFGPVSQVQSWATAAQSAGFDVLRFALPHARPDRAHALVGRRGALANDQDLALLAEEYRVLSPDPVPVRALRTLAGLTLDAVDPHRLFNPSDTDDLAVTGYCFGYPVVTTIACALGDVL